MLATRGNILFHPEGTGEFSARDTSNGELLWRFKAPGSFRSTSVITYQIDGEQYVTTMMNGNRAIDMGGTVLTFKLNGDAELQIPEIAVAELPDLPDTDFTLGQVSEGDTRYHA